MKAFILALALTLGFAAPPVLAASWGDAQAQKARHGREQGEPPRGRPVPPDRGVQGDQRRDQQLNEDERRALHRDLDKANRELYRRR
jgi:hypothetical protein